MEDGEHVESRLGIALTLTFTPKIPDSFNNIDKSWTKEKLHQTSAHGQDNFGEFFTSR